MDKAALFESIEKHTQFSFARSGGKGGQNVNKVNTKVHATMSLARLAGLEAAEFALLKKRLANKINSQEEICVDAEEERFQERNRAIALGKIKSLVIEAAKRPKKRKATRPTAASIEKRLNSKKIRGKLKSLRAKKLLP